MSFDVLEVELFSSICQLLFDFLSARIPGESERRQGKKEDCQLPSVDMPLGKGDDGNDKSGDFGQID